MVIKQLYLAGPDVFLPQAKEIGRLKKALCKKYGFDGLFPLDNEVAPGADPQLTSKTIYQSNLALMQQADAIVANITPFRGPNMDPGTAFKVGYFTALQKPVFLYSNDHRTYAQRVSTKEGVDELGHWVEDFGDVENLMLIRAAALVSLPVTAERDSQYFTSLHFNSKL